MKKYRKKPIIVEAIQFTADFGTMSKITDMAGPDTALRYNDDNPLVFKIDTPGGELELFEHDWVIKEAEGEFCVCPDELFQAAYESVE